MTCLAPIRGGVSCIAGLLSFSLLFFVTLLLSVQVFDWWDGMPAGNIWFWIYVLVSGALSVGLGLVISRLSYRALTKIGAKKKC